VDFRDVADALAQPPSPESDHDWQHESLAELARYIVVKHHAYVRQEIQRLGPLFTKVIGVHGKNHAELAQIEQSFHALSQELTMHLMKEEHMLFPYIEQLEMAANRGARPAPPMFGTVQNPVRMMMLEHDSAGELLHQMRQVTNDYGVPSDACVSFKALYQALQEFEADLHQHIHLENNILFPRAVKLEAQVA
jgi:regulator of cell morphogenesis and NO signaling